MICYVYTITAHKRLIAFHVCSPNKCSHFVSSSIWIHWASYCFNGFSAYVLGQYRQRCIEASVHFFFHRLHRSTTAVATTTTKTIIIAITKIISCTSLKEWFLHWNDIIYLWIERRSMRFHLHLLQVPNNSWCTYMSNWLECRNE